MNNFKISFDSKKEEDNREEEVKGVSTVDETLPEAEAFDFDDDFALEDNSSGEGEEFTSDDSEDNFSFDEEVVENANSFEFSEGAKTDTDSADLSFDNIPEVTSGESFIDNEGQDDSFVTEQDNSFDFVEDDLQEVISESPIEEPSTFDVVDIESDESAQVDALEKNESPTPVDAGSAKDDLDDLDVVLQVGDLDVKRPKKVEELHTPVRGENINLSKGVLIGLGAALVGSWIGVGALSLSLISMGGSVEELEASQSNSADFSELMVVNLQMVKGELREEFLLMQKEASERADRHIQVKIDESVLLMNTDMNDELKVIRNDFTQATFKLKQDVDSNTSLVADNHSFVELLSQDILELNEMVAMLVSSAELLESKIMNVDASSRKDVKGEIAKLTENADSLKLIVDDLQEQQTSLVEQIDSMMVTRGLRNELVDIKRYSIVFATTERALITYKFNGAEEKKILKVGDSFNGKKVIGFNDKEILTK